MRHWILIVLLLLVSWPGWAQGISAPVEIVLHTIAMESASEPIEGQALVAKTIQNRAQRAGISPQEAVLRPKQYSCWNSPKWAKAWLDTNYSPAVRLRALKAWEMAFYSPFKGRHYHTKSVKPYWAKHQTPFCVISNHVFYEGVK